MINLSFRLARGDTARQEWRNLYQSMATSFKKSQFGLNPLIRNSFFCQLGQDFYDSKFLWQHHLLLQCIKLFCFYWLGYKENN
jgi:hypothetical protein